MITIGIIDSSVRIRDMKEIHALKEKYGNEIDFIFMKTTQNPGHQSKIPGLNVIWLDPKITPMVKNVENICKKYNVDILHTHNYPDNYGNWGLQIRDSIGIPVVHECHDIGYEYASAEADKVTEHVMKNVNKIITVSSGMDEYLDKRYGVKDKCTIIYPYPNQKLLPIKMRSMSPECNRMVYQGGLSLNDAPTSKYNHRFYKNIFNTLGRQRLKIEVYPAHPETKPTNHGYFIIRSHVPDISKLYTILTQYDFGFVGYHKTKSEVMDIAMPNKLFEYIACGLPILGMDYDLISKFVTDNKFGVIINKNSLSLPKDFKQQMIDAKMNVLKRRSEFIMENQIHKLKEVYDSVLK